MRLLVDANIPYRLVAVLRALKHDVTSVLEFSPNASDETIIGTAERQKRTIITYDKDFGELVFKLARKHSGVVLLRSADESYESQLKLLKRFFLAHSTKEIQAHFWVLTETNTRRAKNS